MKTIDFFCIAISYLGGRVRGGKECGYYIVGWQKQK